MAMATITVTVFFSLVRERKQTNPESMEELSVKRVYTRQRTRSRSIHVIRNTPALLRQRVLHAL